MAAIKKHIARKGASLMIIPKNQLDFASRFGRRGAMQAKNVHQAAMSPE